MIILKNPKIILLSVVNLSFISLSYYFPNKKTINHSKSILKNNSENLSSSNHNPPKSNLINNQNNSGNLSSINYIGLGNHNQKRDPLQSNLRNNLNSSNHNPPQLNLGNNLSFSNHNSSQLNLGNNSDPNNNQNSSEREEDFKEIFRNSKKENKKISSEKENQTVLDYVIDLYDNKVETILENNTKNESGKNSSTDLARINTEIIKKPDLKTKFIINFSLLGCSFVIKYFLNGTMLINIPMNFFIQFLSIMLTKDVYKIIKPFILENINSESEISKFIESLINSSETSSLIIKTSSFAIKTAFFAIVLYGFPSISELLFPIFITIMDTVIINEIKEKKDELFNFISSFLIMYKNTIVSSYNNSLNIYNNKIKELSDFISSFLTKCKTQAVSFKKNSLDILDIYKNKKNKLSNSINEFLNESQDQIVSLWNNNKYEIYFTTIYFTMIMLAFIFYYWVFYLNSINNHLPYNEQEQIGNDVCLDSNQLENTWISVGILKDLFNLTSLVLLFKTKIYLNSKHLQIFKNSKKNIGNQKTIENGKLDILTTNENNNNLNISLTLKDQKQGDNIHASNNNIIVIQERSSIEENPDISTTLKNQKQSNEQNNLEEIKKIQDSLKPQNGDNILQKTIKFLRNNKKSVADLNNNIAVIQNGSKEENQDISLTLKDQKQGDNIHASNNNIIVIQERSSIEENPDISTTLKNQKQSNEQNNLEEIKKIQDSLKPQNGDNILQKTIKFLRNNKKSVADLNNNIAVIQNGSKEENQDISFTSKNQKQDDDQKQGDNIHASNNNIAIIQEGSSIEGKQDISSTLKNPKQDDDQKQGDNIHASNNNIAVIQNGNNNNSATSNFSTSKNSNQGSKRNNPQTNNTNESTTKLITIRRKTRGVMTETKVNQKVKNKNTEDKSDETKTEPQNKFMNLLKGVTNLLNFFKKTEKSDNTPKESNNTSVSNLTKKSEKKIYIV